MNENKYLLVELNELTQKIPKETEKIIDEMRDSQKTQSYRLTIEQRNLAKNKARFWFNKLIEYENSFDDDNYKINPEYSVFEYSRYSLSSYTKSMFMCMRCGEIVPVNDKLVVKDNIRMHQCKDGELGYGDRTSWINLYATFVVNPILKKCLLILHEIMENE